VRLETDDLPAALATDLDGNFERLVRLYQNRLYAFAWRLSGSPNDAEEIAEDAFVHAYRALGRYPVQQVQTLALRPWLYRIALNVYRNRVRGRRLQTTRLEGLGDGTGRQPADDPAYQPELMAERSEQRAELAALVAALPERYRAAVILRHIQGLSYAEAAAVLGQPVGTVKANVHRGVQWLRERWED